MEATEKQGAIARDVGNCVLVTDLETHRTDWKMAVRIMLNVLILGCGRCSVFGDDVEELPLLSHQYTSDP